jgi:hypothetical protein
MRLAALAALVALTLAPTALAAGPSTTITTTTTTVPARLSSARAISLFRADPKVHAWLKRYPSRKLETQATLADGQWSVDIFYNPAGEIATGAVDDASGAVLSAWTGPQVAWKMARGSPGAFGGKKINSYGVWLSLCAVFLLGLVDWRRPLSLRNVDVLVLLSLSVSLWFFNRGNIFTAMPLAYPPLVWLLVRCVWVARADRRPRGAPVWPVWVLAAATVFLAGFRVGLNVRSSNVIDVGYSGVIGAERIAHGIDPYGHFPVENYGPKTLPACGPSDTEGEIRDRVQTDGRCETANPLGDTYGPVAYIAYLPGYAAFGWSGKWDTLPAVHATSIAFDLLALFGLAIVGRRFGGPRLAAIAAFAWVAWPFTQYASNSNTNDMIGPAILVWGLIALTSNAARGVFVALSGWAKFASLILLPLWSGYPEARRGRAAVHYALGFLAATVAVFFVIWFDPSPLHAIRVFYDRTIDYQIGRESPFSIWDWRQYHAKGLPDLQLLQRALQVILVLAAVALAFVPRQRSPLRLVALTAALLIGFELVLTHWFYLYLPWFFPFVALALLAPLPGRADAEAPA